MRLLGKGSSHTLGVVVKNQEVYLGCKDSS